MNRLPLFLASSSPRRAKLLREAGVRFKVLRSPYHERDSAHPKPAGLVKKHALGKALAASKKIADGRLLAADTTVYFRGKIIGKPKNKQDAFRTLSRLQGRWHAVYTGVALLEMKAGRPLRTRVFVEKTRVKIQKMDAGLIRRYLRRIDPMDKAGSYAIQVKKGGIVEAVRGSFSNAVGLPMERLRFL